MRDKRMLGFNEIIERATQEQPKGELEWFEQVRDALKNGQVQDAIDAIEKAIAYKKRQQKR